MPPRGIYETKPKRKLWFEELALKSTEQTSVYFSAKYWKLSTDSLNLSCYIYSKVKTCCENKMRSYIKNLLINMPIYLWTSKDHYRTMETQQLNNNLWIKSPGVSSSGDGASTLHPDSPLNTSTNAEAVVQRYWRVNFSRNVRKRGYNLKLHKPVLSFLLCSSNITWHKLNKSSKSRNTHGWRAKKI